MSIEEQIHQQVVKILNEWGKDLIEKVLKPAIRKRKLIASNELIDSLKAQIAQTTSAQITQTWQFAGHGRYKDMKNLKFINQPPFNEILDWVRRKGISKFRYVPGYKDANPTSIKAAVAQRRIAFGIAKGIKEKNQHRAKRWYTKNFYEQLGDLTNQLLDAMTEDSIRIFNNASKKR